MGNLLLSVDDTTLQMPTEPRTRLGDLAPLRRFAPGIEASHVLLNPHSGHGWAMETIGDSSVTEDTTRPGPFADRSIKINRVTTPVSLFRNVLPRVDLRDGPLVVWLHLPQPSPAGLFIEAGTTSDYWAWDRAGVSNGATSPQTPDVDGWTAFELYPSDATKVGSPSQVISRVRVRATANGTTAWVGAIAQRRHPVRTSALNKRVLLHPGVTTGWTLAQGTAPGAVTEDTTVPAPFTDRSIRIDYPTSGATGITRTGLDPIDLFDPARPVILWAKWTPGQASPKGLAVRVGDPTFAHAYEFGLYGNRPGVPDYQIGGWSGYVLDPTAGSDVFTIGTPAAMTAIRIRGYADTTAWVGGIEQRSKPDPLYPRGVLTIFFDDAYADTYTRAMPLLAKYGMSAVVDVIVDAVGTSGFATIAQLREMQDRAGWEVAGHSWSPNGAEYRFDQLSPAALEAEFVRLKAWLRANGFDSDTWVSPGGQSNQAVWDVGRRYFTLHRGVAGSGAAGVRFGSRQYSPRMVYPAYMASPNFHTTNFTKAQAKDVVNAVRANRSWGSLTFHQVTTGASSGQVISVTDLDEILAHVADSGVAVRTVKQIQGEANSGAALAALTTT